MSIHEECGVFGVIAPRSVDVDRLVYYGLYALQHRGQESCGIVVNDDGYLLSARTWGWRPGCPWGWRGLRWPQGWAGSESSPSGPLWSGKKFTNMKAAGADLHGQRPFSIEKSSSKSKSITIRLARGILKPSCQKPRAA